MGILAAVTTAVAFFVIGCIPKSEPSIIVSLWFHTASFFTSVIPLTVGAFMTLLLKMCSATILTIGFHLIPGSIDG